MQFGNRERLPVVGREAFEHEVSAGRRFVESYCLPTVSGVHRHLGHRLARACVGTVGGVVVPDACGHVEFVQFRLGAPENRGRAARPNHVEHHKFVAALVQPTAWHIERLLRSDAPEAPYRVPVDVGLPLTERLQINKGITHLAEVEMPAIVSGLAIRCRAALGKCAGGCLVGVGHGRDGPFFQVDRLFVAVNFAAKCDILRDAFMIFD